MAPPKEEPRNRPRQFFERSSYYAGSHGYGHSTADPFNFNFIQQGPRQMLTKHFRKLHLPNTASADDVRKAYRKLVLQYHPDKNPDKETSQQFREVVEAYEAL